MINSESGVLRFCLVLPGFCPQYLTPRPEPITPAKRNQKTEVKEDREVTAFAPRPRFMFAMEVALSPSTGSFLSREERLGGGPGRGAHSTVMSRIASSLGKLIHQTVTSDSVRGHSGKRRHAPVWAF